MKLSTKYVLFVVLVHGVALGLTWFITGENKIYFILAEVLVLLSLLLAASVYKQLISPLHYLMQGIQAIKDRDFNVKFLPTGKREVDQLIDVYNQMIDELRNERTRQEQQHFFLEKLVHTSPTGILILDHDHRVEKINPKALQMLALQENQVLGLLVHDLAGPFFQLLAGLKTGESRMFKPDGLATYKLQKAHFIDRGFPRQFVLVEELTAELLATEKNVYGKVIRMMAHEVNNTIGPVNSILQSALASEVLWQNHQQNNLRNALGVAMDRNQNLNLFMRQFADLVKLPAPKKRPLDLDHLLKRVTELMTMTALEKGSSIHYLSAGTPIIVGADEQLLEQAIINIVKNSLEAIGADGYVRITLDQHRLRVTDNGCGIREEDSANLFSPFFSTKRDGQGIGLTLVREILTGHGWAFWLRTVKEGETVFEITLPTAIETREIPFKEQMTR